jgi:glutamyl-tRNA reductase
MHIVVVGVDHTTASIALRERLSCSSRRIPQVLSATNVVMQECVLLSTCNRIELYAICSEVEEGKAHLLHVLGSINEVPLEELTAHSYSFVDDDAITHLFGVACGLYSLVLGEPQIQGQVAEALEIAQGGGYAGPITSALFRSALITGKRARSETSISRNAVSISHVAVQRAKELFADLHTANVLLVGSGQMSEVAARNLLDNGAHQLVIVNRTHDNAIDLAQSLGATHRSFLELADALVDADVVISSTKAPHALITLDMMRHVMQRRVEQHMQRSIMLIDIALPRDIDPAISQLPDVYLYNIDDLQTQVQQGIVLRLQEVPHVQTIIEEETYAFDRWLASLSVSSTIVDLRRQAETLRQQELARTMRQLAPTLSEREMAMVQELTTRLMNKFLHTPTVQLKEAAASGQGHVYAESLRYLFHLEDEEYDEHKANNAHKAYNHRDTSQQARNDADTVDHRAITPTVARP